MVIPDHKNHRKGTMGFSFRDIPKPILQTQKRHRMTATAPMPFLCQIIRREPLTISVIPHP